MNRKKHPQRDPSGGREFVLQKIQPALLGLMDGAVSTLAPIFAAAGLTGMPQSAFFVGVAASLGAGVSMGLAEAPPAAVRPSRGVPSPAQPPPLAGCSIRFHS